MAIDKGSETTTKLLTLLNVSATKAGKRKWSSEPSRPAEKLNKRKAVGFSGATTEEDSNKDDISDAGVVQEPHEDVEMKEPEDVADDEDEEGDAVGEPLHFRSPCLPDRALDATLDLYDRHFGPDSKDLSSAKRESVEQKEWKTSKSRHGKLGNIVEYSVGESSSLVEGSSKVAVSSVAFVVIQTVDTAVTRSWTSYASRSRNDSPSCLRVGRHPRTARLVYSYAGIRARQPSK